jgi:hypothetical protein
MDRKTIHMQIRRTEGEKNRKVKSDRLTNREKVRDRGKQSNKKKTDISTNKQFKLNRERVLDLPIDIQIEGRINGQIERQIGKQEVRQSEDRKQGTENLLIKTSINNINFDFK